MGRSMISGLCMVVGLFSTASPAAADRQGTVETATATPAYGPGASIQGVCDAISTSEDVTCTFRKLKHTVKSVAPYTKVGLVEKKGTTLDERLLAVQTDDGWFLAPIVSWPSAEGHKLAVDSVKIKNVIPGGDPELVASISVEAAFDDGVLRHDTLWVCGWGASRRLGCVFFVVGATFTPRKGSALKRWRIHLGYSIDKRGRVTRKVKGKWPKDTRYSLDGGAEDRSAYEKTQEILFPDEVAGGGDGPAACDEVCTALARVVKEADTDFASIRGENVVSTSTPDEVTEASPVETTTDPDRWTVTVSLPGGTCDTNHGNVHDNYYYDCTWGPYESRADAEAEWSALRSSVEVALDAWKIDEDDGQLEASNPETDVNVYLSVDKKYDVDDADLFKVVLTVQARFHKR